MLNMMFLLQPSAFHVADKLSTTSNLLASYVPDLFLHIRALLFRGGVHGYST